MNKMKLILSGFISFQILLIGLFSVNASIAADNVHRSAVKTLVIVSHPYPERSVMIKGLQQAAESVEGVTVRNLETIYGYDTRGIDSRLGSKNKNERTAAHKPKSTRWSKYYH